MLNSAPLRLFSALFLSVSLAQAGSEGIQIIGGSLVSDSDPEGASTVALVANFPQGQAICTASILAADLLVTAAHCVTGGDGATIQASQLRVLFGGDLHDRDAVTVAKVSGVQANPNYDPENQGEDHADIAVVTFSGGLPTGYKKAKVLASTSKIPKGSEAVLIGYGVSTMRGGGSGEGVLRKVSVKVADPAFARTEVLLDQRNGKGACHGDSGGPAYARGRTGLLLWGVTSRGNPNGAPDDCSHYSVFTRITAHTAFINRAAKTLRSRVSLARR